MGICHAEATPDTTNLKKTLNFSFTTLQHSFHWGISPKRLVHLTSKSITAFNTTNEGFSYCEQTLSVLLQHQNVPRNNIFNGTPSDKKLLPITNSHFSFISKTNDHSTVSEGSLFCEVSPSICPTEADVDTAALEQNSLVENCYLRHFRRLTRRRNIIIIPKLENRTQTPSSFALHYCTKTSRSIHRSQVSENCSQNKNIPTSSTIILYLLSVHPCNIMTFAVIPHAVTVRDWERTIERYMVGLQNSLG